MLININRRANLLAFLGGAVILLFLSLVSRSTISAPVFPDFFVREAIYKKAPWLLTTGNFIT